MKDWGLELVTPHAIGQLIKELQYSYGSGFLYFYINVISREHRLNPDSGSHFFERVVGTFDDRS